MPLETKPSLESELKKLNRLLAKVYRQQTLLNSFLRGIVTGLGFAIGATLVFAILAFMLRNVNVIPIIGDWLSAISLQVMENLNLR